MADDYLLLLAHLLGAAIWTGGPLVLDDDLLPRLAWHIRLVTALSVLFMIVGASIRFGGAPILD